MTQQSMTRISRDGIDLAGPPGLVTKSGSHGQLWYSDLNRQLLVWDAYVGAWFPANGRCLYQPYASTSKWKALLADDFKFATLDGRYAKGKGSDGAAAYPVPSTSNVHRGELSCVSGAGAGASMAANASLITGPALEFAAANGQITIEAKLKLANIANVWCFFGLTDVLADDSTGLEAPATLATTTFTTNASDAVGFMFDTGATAAYLRCVGVKANTDAMTDATSKVEYDRTGAATATGAFAPVADVYDGLKIVVATDGSARFFTKVTRATAGTSEAAGEAAWNATEWTLQKTLAACVTPATSLTPVIGVFAKTNAQKILTVDYWSCKQ